MLHKYRIVFLTSVLTYLLFFWKLLLPSNIIYSGKDASSFNYPSRIYLSNTKGLPVWTERVFLGFPLYADLEKGYLNPINVVLVKLFGPFNSYKILHFSCYLLGSISLFFFLRKYGANYWGFLAANAVYFFSFFSMYHQQHFNMLLTYYLFPTGLFLLDLLITSSKLRYAILNSLLLTFCFYLGSFQFIFLFLLLEIFYLVSQLGISKRFFSFLWYILGLFLILIIPGVFSTYTLYANSVREGALLHTVGSYTPAMLLNLVFPFLFNFSDKYMGVLLSKEYVMQETYTYVGIATVLFSLLGYLDIRNKSLKMFLNILMLFFIIVSTFKSVPFLSGLNIIPFSLFRYWIRSVSLLNIGLAISIYSFILDANFPNLKKKIWDNKILFAPLLYLLILELFNLDIISVLKVLARNDYVFGYWYFVWGSFLITSLLILFFKRLQKPTFISILITIDILLFSFIATKDSLIKPITEVFPNGYSSNYFKNTRILDLGINGDNALLNSSWGMFGYSVLYSKDMDMKVKELGFSSVRYPTLPEGFFNQKDTTMLPKFLRGLTDLGITKIINASGEVLTLSGNTSLINPIDIPDETLIGNYHHSEGVVSFDVTTFKPLVLKTYITNYPGWNVVVDSRVVKVNKKNMFISIPLSAGEHHVRLQFIPEDLNLGIKISMGILVLCAYLMYISNKKLNL